MNNQENFLLKLKNKWINNRQHIPEDCISVLGSCMILIVSAIVCLAMAMIMFGEVNYDSSQLIYTIANERVGYTDCGQEGIFSYGPYTNLDKGTYEVTIYYETDTDTTFDICYRDDNQMFSWLEEGALKCAENSKTVIINNSQNIQNNSLEVRTYYQGKGFLQINGISIKRKPVVDIYFLVTLTTVLLSFVLILWKKISKFLNRPGIVLSFGCFYVAVICFCLYSMGYLIEQEKIWLYGTLNILIIIYTYISRKVLQDNELIFQYKQKYVYLIIICATIIMGTLYASVIFDYGMNSDDVGMVYAISQMLSNKSSFSINQTGFIYMSHYLSYFFFGESLMTLYIAAIIEFFILIFVGVKISASTSRNYIQLLGICILWFYLFIPHVIPMGDPCWFWQRYHVNINFCFLFIMLCIQKIYEEDKCNKSVYIVFTFILIYSYMQEDALNYVVNIVPLLGIVLLKYRYYAYKRNFKNFLTFWLIVGATVAGKIINSVCSPNVGGRYSGAAIQFPNLDEILNNLKNYINCIFELFDTTFYHTNVLSESTIYYFVKILLLILAIIIMYRELKRAVRGERYDTLIVFMAISFLTVSAAYILSDTYLIPGSARYLNSIIYSFPIVLSRKLCCIDLKGRFNIPRFKYAIFTGIVVLLIIDVRLFPSIDFTRSRTSQDYLSDFLIAHNLKYGYAEYWTAGRTSLASEGKVKLVPALNGIVSGESTWIPYRDWLGDEQVLFNYIILPTSEYDPLVATYGEPIEKYETSGYDIYVYDYDIRFVSS